LVRLEALRVRLASAVAFSAILRGSYHLYQGWGAFVGNAIMGIVFAGWFLRTRRVGPLIVAHSLLDIIAFVGYALFKDRIPFLH
jgi:membrane protease YdiL (CAAX protease family)